MLSSSSKTRSLLPPHTTSHLLGVLVVGPDLVASGLQALLSSVDDFAVLHALSEADEVLPIIERMQGSVHPVEVVVVCRSSQMQHDQQVLMQVSGSGLRSLVITALHSPDELRLLRQAGAHGYLFTSQTPAHLARAVRRIASGDTYFPPLVQAAFSSDRDALQSSRRGRFLQGGEVVASHRTDDLLHPQRQLTFHSEVLQELTDYIGWKLSPLDLQLVRYITLLSVKEIADKVGRRETTVRRDLSERLYECLGLISGREVTSRYIALQILLEYGVLEYTVMPLEQEFISS